MNVQGMTHEQRGIYIDMLAIAWDSEEPGTITLSDSALCRELRIFSATLRRLLADFPATWRRVGGKLVQPKLRLQYLEIMKYKEKKALAGQKGNAVRWHSDRPASASASATARSKPKTKPAAAPLVVPDWVPVEAWNAYVEMRAVRHKITAKGAVLIFKKLLLWREKGQDPRAVLEQSVMNGWTGIFELKGENGHGQKSRGPLSYDEAVSKSLRNFGFQPDPKTN